MGLLLQLFVSFFKIGAFTIGGGYAMLPLMEEELVRRRKWICEDDFVDITALAQSMPGVLAVNVATAVGYRMRGIIGAMAAIVGNVLMPILFILLLAVFFRHFSDNPTVEHVFMGIRPVVVALIAAPVVRLARAAKLSWCNVWIPVATIVMVFVFDISPIWVILIGVVATAALRAVKFQRFEDEETSSGRFDSEAESKTND